LYLARLGFNTFFATMEEQFFTNLVIPLGFHPKNESFNYQLLDVDSLRLHVMNCVGALICLEKKCNIIQAPDGGAKRRVFW